MMTKTEKETKNIKSNLHESIFIDYKAEGPTLTFRIAINCAMSPEIGIECEYGEKYYIYDIICHNYKNFNLFRESSEDLFFSEVLIFCLADDNEYYLSLEVDNNVDLAKHSFAKFEFDCDYIEWKAIKLLDGDDLYSDGIPESYQFK